MSGFARRLLLEWTRLALPLTDASVLVAVSGGADSTALLLGMEELTKSGRLALKVIAAHLDHGLRGAEAAEDARHVEALAGASGFEFVQGRVDVRVRAGEARDNLEQSARRARYEFLSAAAKDAQARLVLTAHTLDDQAETVLLRLLRGSGAEGLSGIEAVRLFEVEKPKVQSPKSKVQSLKSKVQGRRSEAHGRGPKVQGERVGLFEGESVGLPGAERGLVLARPLVGWARRAQTEDYCLERGVEFREDLMNVDERFARVRVRRRLLPLLREFNPRIVAALARTAGLLRDDAFALRALADELLEKASEGAAKRDDEESDGGAPRGEMVGALPLDVKILRGAPQAVRGRALRQWIERGRGHLRRLELVHLRGVEALLEGERGGRVALLPGGARVSRQRGRIYFHGEEVEKGDA